MDDLADLAHGGSRQLGGPGIDAISFGPFGRAAKAKVRAWSHHRKVGNEPWADMALYFDNAHVGYVKDQNFDRANLELEYDLYLAQGMAATFRIQINNARADEAGHGIEVTLTAG